MVRKIKTPEMSIHDTQPPIDAVILWVDGDDPAWKARCDAARGGNALTRRDDIGGDLRFRQMREIDWCVAGINRFAPFIRKIFIVTDGQDPNLENTVGKWFENPIPVEIVDHKVIFRGYERYLPTYQCNSLETMIHRIPGISERFVYFNDDFVLTNHVRPEDWFTSDGKVVEYGKWMPNFMLDLLHAIKPKKNGLKTVGFKDIMENGAKLVGSQKTLLMRHTPHPVLKSLSDRLLIEYPECVDINSRDKFRAPCQFNPQVAKHILAHREGRLEVRSPKGKTLFLKPFANRPNYLRNHLKPYLSGKPLPPFTCINSLAEADPEDRKEFIDFMYQLFELHDK